MIPRLRARGAAAADEVSVTLAVRLQKEGVGRTPGLASARAACFLRHCGQTELCHWPRAGARATGHPP